MNICDKMAREHPSFSSTLLDSIYRSMDESSKPNQDLIFYKETTMKKKQPNFSPNEFRIDPMLLNSSSTSSDSSSRDGFSISSSTSSDSLHNTTSKARPKPIRTHQVVEKKNIHGATGSITAESKALKIYGELKKVKQPISPGAKLSSFINSLFNSGNTKKKTKYEKKTSTTTCSSASSFSRSCLSLRTKTSSRNVAGGTTTQRPVRFCVDEDLMSRPCEKIRTHRVNELRKPVNNNELLNNYTKMKKEADAVVSAAVTVDYDDDYDDDVASYASSDLFELDNLAAIGNERYLEDLPVYETTHFYTNRVIAKC